MDCDNDDDDCGVKDDGDSIDELDLSICIIISIKPVRKMLDKLSYMLDVHLIVAKKLKLFFRT